MHAKGSVWSVSRLCLWDVYISWFVSFSHVAKCVCMCVCVSSFDSPNALAPKKSL